MLSLLNGPHRSHRRVEREPCALIFQAPIAEWNASLAPSFSRGSTFRVVSVRTPDTLYTFGRVSTFIAMDIEDYWFSNHQRTFLLH